MAGASKHQPNSRACTLATLIARVTFPGLFVPTAQAGEFSNRVHAALHSTGEN